MKKESVQEGFSSTSKKDSNEERENRTIKQNRNLNIKIDLEKGKGTGNLGSGNQNINIDLEKGKVTGNLGSGNQNIKIDLKKGKVTGNLGSGNQNLLQNLLLSKIKCDSPAKMECCLEENKKPMKVGLYEEDGWITCELVGKKWENGKWLEMVEKKCIYKCICP